MIPISHFMIHVLYLLLYFYLKHDHVDAYVEGDIICAFIIIPLNIRYFVIHQIRESVDVIIRLSYIDNNKILLGLIIS